jgi:hypothetical protein
VSIVTIIYLVGVLHIRTRKFRTTPRTQGCKDFKDETLKAPASSNFISHSLVCNAIPAAKSWPAFEAQNGKEVEVGENGGGNATSTLGAQRSFMQDFTTRGYENPEKTVTKKGFRELLVKGIVEDDLPYSLGEKSGMSKLFKYLLPYGFTVASHQTIRCDLDTLYEKLSSKVDQELQVSLVLGQEQAVKLK